MKNLINEENAIRPVEKKIRLVKSVWEYEVHGIIMAIDKAIDTLISNCEINKEIDGIYNVESPNVFYLDSVISALICGKEDSQKFNVWLSSTDANIERAFEWKLQSEAAGLAMKWMALDEKLEEERKNTNK